MNREPGFRTETQIAITAVERGLQIARQGSGVDRVVHKATRDIATGTDEAVEDAIRALLADALDIPLVGEERGGDRPDDGSAYWLLDPLCGTQNFAFGAPLYAVNLALVESGQVAAAIVGDSTRGEILVAEKGRGASVVDGEQRRPLTASTASEVLVVEEGKTKGPRRAHAANFFAAAVAADRWDIRSLGSTLSLPYVAGGRVSAAALFWVTDIHGAAGCLLATEAGAVASDIFGEPWTLKSDSLLLAATAELHQELLELSLGAAPPTNIT